MSENVQDERRETPPIAESETLASPSSTYDTPWLDSLLRPFLVVVLVTCINVAAVLFLRQYATGMPPGVLWTMLGLGVATGIIGVTSTTWLAHPAQRLRRSAGYRIAEIVLLLLLARIAIWIGQGALPPVEAFLNRPDEVFLDGPYLLCLLALLFTWLAAIDFTDDLAQLGLQPDELFIAQTANTGVHDTSRPAQTDRSATLRRFTGRWIGWGIFLIFIAAGLRLGVTRQQFWTLARQDIAPSIITVIIVYFLCGLILISQGQLAMLRARWTLDRLPKSDNIFRNWPIYTMSVLVVMALIAVFLPLGDTLLISRVLTFILDALYFTVSLIFQLVSLLLFLLFSLLPHSNTIPPPPAAAEQVSVAPPVAPSLLLPAWLGGALFWITMIFILAVAAYFYLSDKPTSLLWLRRLLNMIRLRWEQLLVGWRSWRRTRALLAAQRRQEEAAGGKAGRRWWPLRWSGLTPEQQVRYLYFQLLDEAAQHQQPRHESETPNTYAPRLSEAVTADPEADDAIRALTDAFVQVRYAGESMPTERVSWLERAWKRLRTVFGSKPD
jgi:hypothetical protein